MSVEILMMLSNGAKMVDGEGRAEFSISDDDLMKGFQKGKFFVLDDFDFDVGLEDDDDADESGSGAGGGGGVAGNRGNAQTKTFATNAEAHARHKASKKRFMMWMRGKRDLATDGYPVDMQPCGFTKQLDMASPTLFDACANSKPFTSATVVKRKVVGLSGKSVKMEDKALYSQVFLRLDFDSVLIVGLSWDVEETVIKEKCKFVCRGITVQYRPQHRDGSLGIVVPASWKYKD